MTTTVGQRVSLRLSASQVQLFRDCQRAWSWKYVMGIDSPPSPAAELGSEVHTQLETYLLGGELDFTKESGYIAASGLEHLPEPLTPGMLVEGRSSLEELKKAFHFYGPSGHSYLGYKDVQLPTDGRYGVVIDHKTTSNFRYQKTVSELLVDVQSTLYSVDYFREHPQEQEVELRWVYYATKGAKKSAVTSVTMNQEHAWQLFLEIEETAEQMAAVSNIHPLDLPSNINHCAAYGGCPHQGRCNLSPFDKMRSYSMNQNSLLARLGKIAAPASNVVPIGAHQLPPAVAPAAANPLLARLQTAGIAATPIAPAVQTTLPAATAPRPNPLLGMLRAPGVVPPAINPPEYQPPPVAPVAELPQAAPVQALPAAPALLAAPPAPRGPGRPRKSKDAETVAQPATGDAKIGMLFLNCGPSRPVHDANTWIVSAKQRIVSTPLADGTVISDYRFAPFGQGPGMLALAVAAEIDAIEATGLWVRLDTTTPEGSIAMSELVSRAAVVVR